LGFVPTVTTILAIVLPANFLVLARVNTDLQCMKQQVGGMPTTGGSSVDSIMLVGTTCIYMCPYFLCTVSREKGKKSKRTEFFPPWNYESCDIIIIVTKQDVLVHNAIYTRIQPRESILSAVIGASLSEPHTSVTSLHPCV